MLPPLPQPGIPNLPMLDAHKEQPPCVLAIDDNHGNLQLYHQVLVGDTTVGSPTRHLDALEAALFGSQPAAPGRERPRFALSLCSSGQDGRDCMLRARAAGRPYALAFVDMHMPGGWDGLQTIEALWREDPELQVVICSAYADHSWEDISARLGRSDRLLILRKPFDPIEILQLACTLCEKWNLQRARREQLSQLERHVAQRTQHLQSALEQRRRAEQELLQFFQLSPDVLCVLDDQGRFVRLSPAIEALLDYRPEELQGQFFAQIVDPLDRPLAADCLPCLTHPAQDADLLVRCRGRDGSSHWLEWRFSAAGHDGLLYGIGRDVSARQAAEDIRKRLAVVLEATSDIVGFSDADGRLQYLNRKGRELAGLSEQAVAGQRFADFHPDWASQLIREQAFPCAMAHGIWHGESAIRCADGRELAVSQIIEAHRGADGEIEFISSIMRDISERKVYEAQLQHQATHDALTGLANRTLFMDRLRQALAQARRHAREVLVAFIDLDRFKLVNDSLGHDTGDELLKALSQRMAGSLRDTDTLARFGGDEFVLLLPDLPQASDGMLVIGRLLTALGEPLQLAGQRFQVTCSIGCSTYPGDGDAADDLLRFADAAMYRAKELGRANLQVYNAELRAHIDERLLIENALHDALERNQLSLHYQPQVDLRSGRILGLEALLRWQHPELGAIEPSRFIPIAEETGLIEAIGRWTLYRACAQLLEWRRQGFAPLPVAVNLSAHQALRPGLAEMIGQCLAETGVPPQWLELELTESASMDDPERVIPLMQQLRQLGVSLSLDDFGSGYSNMRYLKLFPVQKLKLDGSFIKDITHDAGSMAIVDATIAMAHRLGLKVVAEMAETEGQVIQLAAHGCDQVQGHYFSRALPPEQLETLLRARQMALPGGLDTDDGRRRILILDDEVPVTAALQRALHQEDYQVLSANNAAQAFDLLARHPVGVVLSDQRMPDMSGSAFLNQVRMLYPDSVRILFTGYTDFQSAQQAINQGAVHQLLSKPWDDQQLCQRIIQALEQYRYSRQSNPNSGKEGQSMKGMIYTEFLDMVEKQHGLDMVDGITRGAYTVGNYEHGELLRLVTALGDATGCAVPELVRQYGEYLFQRFSSAYPQYFIQARCCFSFLRAIEAHIHVEVRKLYPDAELPSFSYDAPTPDELIVEYCSPRGLADLAEGLILGCIRHYREAIQLTRSDLPKRDGEQRARFHLTRQMS